MTDTAIPRAKLIAGVEAAALVLAQKLGLGDETRVSDDWPIDQGDSVLRMAFADDPTSSLVLAVNDEVAERLMGNPTLLNSTFAEATQAMNTAAGTELAPGTVEHGEAMRPEFIAEILDSGQLTALAGLTMPAGDRGGAGAPAGPAAEAFEPAPLDPTPVVSSPTPGSSSLSVLASGQSTPASRAYIAISLTVVLLMPSAAATCRMLRPESPASS